MVIHNMETINFLLHAQVNSDVEGGRAFASISATLDDKGGEEVGME